MINGAFFEFRSHQTMNVWIVHLVWKQSAMFFFLSAVKWSSTLRRNWKQTSHESLQYQYVRKTRTRPRWNLSYWLNRWHGVGSLPVVTLDCFSNALGKQSSQDIWLPSWEKSTPTTASTIFLNSLIFRPTHLGFFDICLLVASLTMAIRSAKNTKTRPRGKGRRWGCRH